MLRKDRPVNVFAPGLHRDPSVWDDPEEFDIDRWLPEAEAARHPHAYKPFGNGERACIGRQFAMVEAKIAMAMMLQTLRDQRSAFGYRLRIKETLSIKPDDFFMRIRLRQPHERLSVGAAAPARRGRAGRARSPGTGQQLRGALRHRSLGTARDIAEEIAERARVDGFDVVVRSMDESFKGGAAPEDKVIVIVTATYNGRAPDSAVEVERALDAGRVRGRRLVGRARSRCSASATANGRTTSSSPSASTPRSRRRARRGWCRARRRTGRAISTARSPASSATCGRRWAARAGAERGGGDAVADPGRRRRDARARRCPNMRSGWRSSPTTSWSARRTACGTSRRSRRARRPG